MTHDTRPEHLEAEDGPPRVQAALPAGRHHLDLWALAAARLVQLGASPRSRLLRAAGAELADAFEGEPLSRAVARLAAAGLLPGAAEAAAPDRGPWRSPLITEPARALLVRALLETTAPGARRRALLGWLGDDAPGTLDSLARRASVPARALEARYRALADSLARLAPAPSGRIARAPWRAGDGFQRGVCLAHSVGLERGYLSRGAASQLARIRAAGADWVSLTPFAWLADPRRPVLGVSADQGPDGESDEAVAEAAARAHALGLRVWLKPHVWTRGWAGELSWPPAGWARFFDAYEQVLLHWALLAEREGFDGLVVGHELSSSTVADPARWRALIASARRVYGGLLTYDANWDEVARVPFWDALDLIGVSFYTPLASRPTDDPRVLRRGAERALDVLAPLAARFQRPVLLAELGYPAARTAAVRPWQEPDGGEDPDAQRACLEATVAALEPREWVAGAFFWRWGSAERADDAFDPRGRPAESVMTRALASWQGRPVRLPRAPRNADRQGRGRR